MNRRDRLRGHRFRVALNLDGEVRRSCRDELKIIYQATGTASFTAELWRILSTLGRAEVLRASHLHPRMRDLFRVHGQGLRVEGAVGDPRAIAFYRGFGRMGARHRVERLLAAAFGGLVGAPT